MASSRFYCQAFLPRGGLGNRLFPWARCRLFAFKNHIPMLAPVWSQFKLGPLLRGESDSRFYHNLFMKAPKDIRGLQSIWLQWIAEREKEPENWEPSMRRDSFRPVIVTFEGLQDYFRRLNGSEQFLRQELLAITRKRWLSLAFDRLAVIGIHVRCGDIPLEVRTPISWYVESLTLIRRTLRIRAPAQVFSDGRSEELQELLAIPEVTRIQTGSSIGDLLALSRSQILIASASSFSAWASFLGQMPTVSPPGRSLSWFQLSNQRGYYIGELDPALPAEVLIKQLQQLTTSS